MPFLHLHDLDKPYIGLQYPEVPILEKPRCSNLELDWLRCANGLGWNRAKKECKLELGDFLECCQGTKKVARVKTIMAQRDKLVSEGKYTPPPEHR
ncbi:NADH dehydrogenase [ubiquinone] iron-sulfur protein 5-like [Asterias rubens]|uniref:NADH dehydrogenase [ubiquinone] iron-sulfur protein 5-like n=1 Tax=Asterias rubens TaxID=7604 RepID=UPI00145523AD|nr:NADH dehydrogenase [ubiquinone] iron-sulfur protein 5-like [Asterias rubens]